MAIRLNKVVRELNIGLQTAVEFLMKKSELGEVEENPNFKLNDAQYEALVEAFKSDKEVRNQAAKIFPKKPKEKKKEPESHRAEALLESGRQQVRQLPPRSLPPPSPSRRLMPQPPRPQRRRNLLPHPKPPCSLPSSPKPNSPRPNSPRPNSPRPSNPKPNSPRPSSPQPPRNRWLL